MIEACLRLPFGFLAFTPPSSLMFGFCSVRKPSEINTKVASWSKRVAKIKIRVGEQEKK